MTKPIERTLLSVHLFCCSIIICYIYFKGQLEQREGDKWASKQLGKDSGTV